MACFCKARVQDYSSGCLKSGGHRQEQYHWELRFGYDCLRLTGHCINSRGPVFGIRRKEPIIRMRGGLSQNGLRGCQLYHSQKGLCQESNVSATRRTLLDEASGNQVLRLPLSPRLAPPPPPNCPLPPPPSCGLTGRKTFGHGSP